MAYHAAIILRNIIKAITYGHVVHSSGECHSLRLWCDRCLLESCTEQLAQQHKETEDTRMSMMPSPPQTPLPHGRKKNNKPPASPYHHPSASTEPRQFLEKGPPPKPPSALTPDRSLNRNSIWMAWSNFQPIFLLLFVPWGRDQALDPAWSFRVSDRSRSKS